MMVFSFTARGCSSVPSITGTFGPVDIRVQQADCRAQCFQRDRQIHRHGGLAHAAFAAGHGHQVFHAFNRRFLFHSSARRRWMCMSMSGRHCVPFAKAALLNGLPRHNFNLQ